MKIYHTEKREELLRFFRKNEGRALSLTEICSALTQDGQGKSTLYRLVSKFVEEGCVRKLADPKTRHNTYQWLGCQGCEHLHLKCTGCGKLIHLDHETSLFLSDALASRASFLLSGEDTLLFGKCKNCNV